MTIAASLTIPFDSVQLESMVFTAGASGNDAHNDLPTLLADFVAKSHFQFST